MAVTAIKIEKAAYKDNSLLIYKLSLYVLAGLVIMGLILLKSRSAATFWTDPILLFYTIFITTFQLSRLITALFYNYSYEQLVPTSALNSPQNMTPFEPTVTFVIPCKNEEKAIGKTVSKCFEADYPSHLIEVIVINDGSTDRTGEVLEELKNEKYPGLTIVNWKINKGKRHGMAEGFRLAKGEIVVQLDSDSYIRPELFSHLIEPFRNPEIGAVCAHTDAENADENILTKMQTAYYYMSFRILKAAESTYGVVFCCSGCSSAYRRDLVLPLLDEFMNEKFLGLPVTWGDDRSLTNRILELGYKTIYTDRAKAYTIVPNNFRQLVTQQIRWKKGWFVNSITASRFIYRKQPFVTFTYFWPLILVTLLTPFMAARAIIYYSILLGHNPIYYLFGIFLVTSLFVIFYRLTDRENKYWPYIYAWSLLNTFFLCYLLPYALITIQNRKWGTR